MSFYTLLVSDLDVNCALLIAVVLLFALLLGEFRTTAKGQIDLRPRALPSGHPPPLKRWTKLLVRFAVFAALR